MKNYALKLSLNTHPGSFKELVNSLTDAEIHREILKVRKQVLVAVKEERIDDPVLIQNALAFVERLAKDNSLPIDAKSHAAAALEALNNALSELKESSH